MSFLHMHIMSFFVNLFEKKKIRIFNFHKIIKIMKGLPHNSVTIRAKLFILGVRAKEVCFKTSLLISPPRGEGVTLKNQDRFFPNLLSAS